MYLLWNKAYESRIERFLTFWTHPPSARPGLLLLQFLKVIFYWMIAEVSSAAQLAWECPENCNNGKLLSIHQHVPLMNFTFFLFKIATTGEKEIRSRRWLLHTHTLNPCYLKGLKMRRYRNCNCKIWNSSSITIMFDGEKLIGFLKCITKRYLAFAAFLPLIYLK